MKKARFLLVFVILIVLVLAMSQTALADGKAGHLFAAVLLGQNEVPPVSTDAHGSSILRLDQDETTLRYLLSASDIENVTAAHIHCGAPGVNGPVVAFLFPAPSDGTGLGGLIPEDELFVTGTVTPAHVIPRPDSDVCPGGVANFADMIEKMRTGQAYVNVHTTQNPGGEIRGQVITLR